MRYCGRLALENTANSDALYHDVNHIILVTKVGREILHGKHLSEGSVTPRDWLHFVISLLATIPATCVASAPTISQQALCHRRRGANRRTTSWRQRCLHGALPCAPLTTVCPGALRQRGRPRRKDHLRQHCEHAISGTGGQGDRHPKRSGAGAQRRPDRSARRYRLSGKAGRRCFATLRKLAPPRTSATTGPTTCVVSYPSSFGNSWPHSSKTHWITRR